MLYGDMGEAQLIALQNKLKKEYDTFKAKGLKLDMSRGKPGAEQLDLSLAVLDDVNRKSGVQSVDGTDCRNYGVLDGIVECKEIFAELLGVEPKNIIIGGNSSLTMMFDYISQCMTHGAGEEPWMKQGEISFICPVPGYDRHFSICEYFGIKMIPVPTLDGGPDMDRVDELIKDSRVKGMFVVPKYSNPQGNTFSDACVKRMAAMKPAAKDFRVIWDNAYCIHDLNDTPDVLMNIFDACKEYASEDMFIEVTSTSKITFPGSGVSAIAASDRNIQMIKERLAMQTIGHDKLNQLRHARYFGNVEGLKNHMRLHADILRPKFNMVCSVLEKELGGKGIAEWTNPNGGYFISLDVMKGCAKKVVALCKEAGVVLTGAGATYPYGMDPEDKNIRIAPSFPPVEELKLAAELLCLCVQLASVEKLLEK